MSHPSDWTRGPDGRINGLLIIAAFVLATVGYTITMMTTAYLPRILPALPAIYAITLCAAIVATYLLFFRAHAMGSERLAWVGSALALTSLAMFIQIVGFPSYTPDDDLLATTSHEAATLYVLWHLIVPGFALLSVAELKFQRQIRRLLTAFSAGIIVYVAWGGAVIPAMFDSEDRYTSLHIALLIGTTFLSVIATGAWALAHGRRPTWTQAWITASLALSSADVLLHTFAGERFTTFWWASLWMRMGQHIILAGGLLLGFVAIYHSLNRYSASLSAHLDELLRQNKADEHLVRFPEDRTDAAERIRGIIRDRNINIVFQPIVELRSGEIVGAEALSRFPSESPRPPNETFREAADAGFGTELELLAVRSALDHLPDLPDSAHLSINVSPEAFLDSELLSIITEYPDAHRVILEITEHAEIHDYEPLRQRLHALRSLGVRLAVDDLGAGFANLRHVISLDPDLLKLDIALTQQIAHDPVSQTMARSLAAFAHETGTTLVAEGVETEEQLEHLSHLGVGLAQGYLFARPGPLPLPEFNRPLPAGSGPGLANTRERIDDKSQPIWDIDQWTVPASSDPGHGLRPMYAGIFAAILAMVVFYLFLMPSGFWQVVSANILFTLASGVAAGICLWAARQQRDTPAKPWIWIGMGCGTWFAGMLVWNYYELLLRVEPPYPSLADLGYISFYPLVAAGIVSVIRSGVDQKLTVSVALDGFIVLAFASMLVVELYLDPTFLSGDPSLIELAASTMWAAGSAGLVFLVILSLGLQARGVGIRSMLMLTAGILLITIGNVVYSGLALAKLYSIGNPIDLTWLVGFLVVACAGVQSIAERPRIAEHASRRVRQVLTLGFGLFTGVSALGFGLFIAYEALQGSTDWSLIVAGILIGVLLCTRLVYAALQSEWLGRSTSERDRLESIVEASHVISRSGEIGKLLDSIADLAGRVTQRDRATVRLFTEGRTDVEEVSNYQVSTVERAILGRLLSAPVGVLSVEKRVIETRLPSIQRSDDPDLLPGVQEILRAAGKNQALLTPVITQGEVLGVIEVWNQNGDEPFNPLDYSALAVIGFQAGIAVRNQRLVDELRSQAIRDGLTGLFNHQAITSLVQNAVTSYLTEQRTVSVLMIDLDGFKNINDTYGHSPGDLALKALATMLRDATPSGGAVGRLGGDEFLVLLPDYCHESAREWSERLRSTVEHTLVDLEVRQISMSLSVGVATAPDDKEDVDKLLALADQRMYEDKRSRSVERRRAFQSGPGGIAEPDR